MRKLQCLRCQITMTFLMKENFQKGDCGAWVGNLNFSFRGGFEMEVYGCSRCGKLEFYAPEDSDFILLEEEREAGPESNVDIVSVSMDGIPQIRCPHCGKEHDFDYPRCPKCDYQY